MMQKGDVTVRKAVVDDVKDIHALLMQAALKGQLLPRALTYLYGHVRNFFVLVKPDGEIVGCVALAPVWEDLAEVASLVIREDQRGKGLGLLAVRRVLLTALPLALNACSRLPIRKASSIISASPPLRRMSFPRKSGPTVCTAPSTPTATNLLFFTYLRKNKSAGKRISPESFDKRPHLQISLQRMRPFAFFQPVSNGRRLKALRREDKYDGNFQA